MNSLLKIEITHREAASFLRALTLCLNFILSACNSDLAVFTAKAPKPSVLSLSQLEVAEADTITVFGSGFTNSLELTVNDAAIALTLESATQASFVMPALAKGEFQYANFISNAATIATFALVDKDRASGGISNVNPETLCTDVLLTKDDGSVVRGTRNCYEEKKICSVDGEIDCVTYEEFPSIVKADIANAVVEGKTLALVPGSVPKRPLDCNADGQEGCVTHTSFPAAEVALIHPSKIKSGVSIAGVEGTLVPIGFPCAADGEVSCLTYNGFVAIDKVNSVQANLSKISGSFTLLGLTGSLVDCVADGETSCVVHSPAFAAAAISGAESKISSGLTLAGINGIAPLKPAECASDGATACVATSTFPAADRATISSNTAKIRSNFSIAGVTGTLHNCSSDGQDACVAVGPTYAAALTGGAQAKIQSGQILAGITGNAAARPADCSSDGESNCVATPSFLAFEAAIAAPKIVLGQTIGGVTGTAGGVKPSDCIVDGEIGCTTLTTFPAMQESGADAKIAAGDSLGGVIGTAGARPSDCTANGSISCVAVSSYPALDKGNLDLNGGALRAGFSLLGVPGALNNCSLDGGTACVTTASFPAADKLNSAAKVLSGSSVGGISGTALPRPSDCSSDGGIGCVAITNYPAINKTNLSLNANKFHSSLTLATVTGTLADCSLDGDLGCVAVTGFPAANTTNAAAKILSGSTLAAINGSAAVRPSDCAAGNISSCVAVTNFPSLDRINWTNNTVKARTTLSVSGTSGTLGNCSTDNQTNCVTSATNPAVVASSVSSGVVKSGSVIAGVTGAYPNSTYPLAVGDGYADVTTSNFQASLKSATNFGWFNRSGARYSAAGSANLVAGNIKSGVEIFGVTGNSPGGALNPPSVKIYSTTSTAISYLLERACCIATHVLVVRRLGAPVIWAPTNGTNYSTADLSDNQKVFAKDSNTQITDSGLTSGQIYHYAFYSVDANNNYSSSATTSFAHPYASGSFGTIIYNGETWYTQRSSFTAEGYPAWQSSDNSIVMNPSTSGQGVVMFRPIRVTPNMEIEFDYKVNRDGADGFGLSFGKDFIGEYANTNPSAGSAVGMLRSGTGYGVAFTTGTNAISVWDLSANNKLYGVNIDLEGSPNSFIHVKIQITANSVKVYLAGSTTPVLDYTNGSNWSLAHAFVGFSSSTGTLSASHTLRNITISNY